MSRETTVVFGEQLHATGSEIGCYWVCMGHGNPLKVRVMEFGHGSRENYVYYKIQNKLVFFAKKIVKTYCKIPVISPGLIQLRKGF